MSVARKGVWTALAAVGCAVGLLVGAGSALAEEAKFTFTEKEQKFEVPAGVTSVHVVAVGGAGGSGFRVQNPGGAGGLGAVVSANLGVKAGQTLYVEVGGEGETAEVPGIGKGGFNGGGNGENVNGGGGGASDVRTESRTEAKTLESRLLVAAGGGGGGQGKCGGGSGGHGGAGGNAQEEGHAGVGECAGGGSGGGAGTSEKGGSAGSPRGQEGTLSRGGGTGGGGGGGGLYGGGSGGEGSSGGGGGGGSNLTAGGESKLAEAGQETSVTITYTLLPTSKEQCKNGGWKNFGTTFKNQGQCVRFVNHNS